MSVAHLVRQLARSVDSPVKLFLDLPAKEADARFRKMFVTLGKHPLVGVGALGGLVALFAYTKALVELDDLGLRSAGLLGSGDLADFASRFAVPFIFMVVAFISLMLAWTGMLKADHRRPARFLGALLPGVIGLAAAWGGYFWWTALHPVDPRTFSTGEMNISDFGVPLVVLAAAVLLVLDFIRFALSGRVISPHRQVATLAGVLVGILACVLWTYYNRRVQIPTLIFFTALVLAIAPAWPLLRAGMEPGVENDDRWQYALLRIMRSLSNAFGLLVVFSGLATALLFSASVSVLAVRNDPSDKPPGADLRVLESKQVEPMFINPAFLRLSSVWLVNRVFMPQQSQVAGAGPGTPTPMPVTRTTAWWMVPPGEIACVRYATREERSAASPKRLCSTSSTKPGLPPLPENSIAAYAVRMFGCARESFTDDAIAWVVGFAVDDPRGVEKGPLKESSWTVSASALTLPTLQGVRFVSSTPGDAKYDILARLRKERPGSIWVMGFASTGGTSTHNLNLSERRAIRLKDILSSEAGVEAKRIKARGLSEDTYSGVFEIQKDQKDQVAVAFYCLLSQ